MIGDDEYTESVDVLSELLLLDEWYEIEKPLDETLLMTIQLSELYEINLYENCVWVYYGYASIGETKTAYYSIPKAATENIRSYIDNLSS